MAIKELAKLKPVDTLDITPAIATEILHHNTKNRPIKKRAVTKYANLMREGKWEFNGEPIIITKNDKLADGQHRLHAIINSRTTQKMVIVQGVDPSAFKTIDIGKKRSGADALATYNEAWAKTGAVLSAAVTTILHFDDAGVYHEDRVDNPPTHEELIEYVENHKSIERSVEFTRTLTQAKKFVPWSAMSALHFLFSKKDVDLTEEFFNKLNSGENLERNHPILLLRFRLMNMKASGGIFRTREVMPLLLKTWQHMRTGKFPEKLRIDDEFIPEIV